MWCCFVFLTGVVAGFEKTAIAQNEVNFTVSPETPTVAESANHAVFTVGGDAPFSDSANLRCWADLEAGTIEGGDLATIEAQGVALSALGSPTLTATCQFALANDALLEPDETLVVKLFRAGEVGQAGMDLAEGRVTITSDETAALTITGDTGEDQDLTEGSNTGSGLNYTFTLTRGASTVTELAEDMPVAWIFTGDVESTDFAGADFADRDTAGSANVEAAAFTGETITSSLQLATADDSEDEDNEEYELRFALAPEWVRSITFTAGDPEASGTLIDNDADDGMTIVSITSGDAETIEPDAGRAIAGQAATIVLGLSDAAPTGGAAIPIALSLGRDVTIGDWRSSVLATGTGSTRMVSVQFVAGATRASFTISAMDDRVWENAQVTVDEAVTVGIPASLTAPYAQDTDTADQSVRIRLVDSDIDPPRVEVTLQDAPNEQFSEQTANWYFRTISAALATGSTHFPSTRMHWLRLTLNSVDSSPGANFGDPNQIPWDLAVTPVDPSGYAQVLLPGNTDDFDGVGITISPHDDAEVEEGENIFLTAGVVGSSLASRVTVTGGALRLGTLFDNDEAPSGTTVTMTPETTTVAEGAGHIEFAMVALGENASFPSANCWIDFEAGTVESEDLAASQLQVIAPIYDEEEISEATCRVNLADDTLLEPDEALVVKLFPSGKAGQEGMEIAEASVTIISDETASLTVTGDTGTGQNLTEDATVNNSLSYSFTLTRGTTTVSRLAEALPVTWTFTGEVESTDFVGNKFTDRDTTGTLGFEAASFGANPMTGSLGFAIADDSEEEDDEAYELRLTIPSEWASRITFSPGDPVVSGLVIDDDADDMGTIVSITSGDTETIEPDALTSVEGTVATIVVGLSNAAPAGGVDIPLTLTLGDDITDGDWSSSITPKGTGSTRTVSVRFAEGTTRASFTIAALDDNIWEHPAMTFRERITVSVPAILQTGYIQDTDTTDQSVRVELRNSDNVPPHLMIKFPPVPSVPFSEDNADTYSRMVAVALGPGSTGFPSTREQWMRLTLDTSASSDTSTFGDPEVTPWDLAVSPTHPSGYAQIDLPGGTKDFRSAVLNISPVDDMIFEPDEDFVLNIEVGLDSTLFRPPITLDISSLDFGTLVDNEEPIALSFTRSTYDIREGETSQIDITYERPIPEVELGRATISFVVEPVLESGASEDDYDNATVFSEVGITASRNTNSWEYYPALGRSAASIPVHVTRDNLWEANEQMQVSLAFTPDSGTSTSIFTAGTIILAVINIIESTQPPIITLDACPPALTEEGGATSTIIAYTIHSDGTRRGRLPTTYGLEFTFTHGAMSGPFETLPPGPGASLPRTGDYYVEGNFVERGSLGPKTVRVKDTTDDVSRFEDITLRVVNDKELDTNTAEPLETVIIGARVLRAWSGTGANSPRLDTPVPIPDIDIDDIKVTIVEAPEIALQSIRDVYEGDSGSLLSEWEMHISPPPVNPLTLGIEYVASSSYRRSEIVSGHLNQQVTFPAPSKGQCQALRQTLYQTLYIGLRNDEVVEGTEFLTLRPRSLGATSVGTITNEHAATLTVFDNDIAEVRFVGWMPGTITPTQSATFQFSISHAIEPSIKLNMVAETNIVPSNTLMVGTLTLPRDFDPVKYGLGKFHLSNDTRIPQVLGLRNFTLSPLSITTMDTRRNVRNHVVVDPAKGTVLNLGGLTMSPLTLMPPISRNNADVNCDGFVTAIDGFALYMYYEYSMVQQDPGRKKILEEILRDYLMAGNTLAMWKAKIDMRAATGGCTWLDINKNGVTDKFDGMLFLSILSFPELLGDGTLGSGFRVFRTSMLGRYSTPGDDSHLRLIIRTVRALRPNSNR